MVFSFIATDGSEEGGLSSGRGTDGLWLAIGLEVVDADGKKILIKAILKGAGLFFFLTGQEVFGVGVLVLCCDGVFPGTVSFMA